VYIGFHDLADHLILFSQLFPQRLAGFLLRQGILWPIERGLKWRDVGDIQRIAAIRIEQAQAS